MRTKISKHELLEVLTANKDKHRTVFEAAVKGYKAEALKQLHEHIRRIEKGRLVRVQVFLPTPEDHTQDYDRVIRMVTMSTQGDIDMDEQMFAQYVMDDWHWKREWLRNSSSYAKATVKANYGDADGGEEEDI